MIDCNKGGEYWQGIPVERTEGLPAVTVAGIPEQAAIEVGDSEKETIRKIRSWGTVAILAVQRPDEVPVYYGFRAGDMAKVYQDPVMLSPEEPFKDSFAVRIGNGDVTFFVEPGEASPDTELGLSLVGTYNIDDPQFSKDFPLY